MTKRLPSQRAPSPASPTTSDTPAVGSFVGTDTSVVAGGKSADQADAFLPLARLKHYRLVELIGRGGMGDVYRAHDEMFQREVAIKVLPADLASDEQFVRRFQREAKAIAGLSHPNIVPVYGIDHDHEHFFYAMQFVAGESLDQRLRREKKIPLQEALRIATACLSALEAAHARGLIHRDVKPGNVLLQEHTDHVFLVDFGLVRRVDDQSLLTVTGMVMGTVDYMAPEQARGHKDIDLRADLYSVGAMLYHVLSGRLPFAAHSLSDMLYCHAYESPIQLAECAPELPLEIVQLIERLMAKKPDDRLANCRAVIDALAPLQTPRFRTQRVAEQIQEVSKSTPSQAYAELPEAYGGWQRISDRAASMIRQRSPEWLQHWQTIERQVDCEVDRSQRNCQHLHALQWEGQQLLRELQKQRSEAPKPDLQPDDQIAQLTEQLAQLDLQVAQADSQHAQLANRRAALAARLAMTAPRAPIRSAKIAFLSAGGAVALCLIWLAFFLTSGSEVAPPTDPPHRTPVPRSRLEAGLWHDLMPYIDLTRDTVTGQWALRADRSLHASGGNYTNGHARLQLPVFPQGPYELEASISRDDGSSDANLVFPVGPYNARAQFGHTKEGCVPSHPPSGEVPLGIANAVPPMPVGGPPSKVRVVVHPDEERATIKVYVDGTLTCDWAGRPAEVANNAPCQIPDTRALGLTVSNRDVIYHSLQLRMLSGHADLYSPPAGTVELQRGLVAHYKFNESQGLYAHDPAGKYDGRLTGAKWTKGFDDGALYFDGDDYLLIPKPLLNRQPNYTFTGWVRDEGSPGQFHLYADYSGDLINSSIRLNKTTMHTAIWTPTAWRGNSTPSGSVVPGKWHFIAARFTAVDDKEGTMKVWIDGQSHQYPLPVLDANRANNAKIGMNGRGSIEDVRIYHRSLSDAEVAAVRQLQADKAASANSTSTLVIPALAQAVDPNSELSGPLETLSARIAAAPRDSDRYLTRAYWFAARGRWQEACQDMEQGLQIRADMWWCRTELARLYLFLGDQVAYERHCQYLHSQLQTRPEKDHVHLMRPLCLAPVRWEKELAQFAPVAEQQLAQKPTDGEILRTTIELRYAAGQWAACIEAAEKLVPGGPKHVIDGYPWLYRIMALHHAGRKDEAQKELRQFQVSMERQRVSTPRNAGYDALPLDKRIKFFTFNGLEASIVYRQASELILKNREELKLAVAIETRSLPAELAANPTSAADYNQRADWYIVRQQWTAAASELQNSLKLDPAGLRARAHLTAISSYLEDHPAYDLLSAELSEQLQRDADEGALWECVRPLLLSTRTKDSTLRWIDARFAAIPSDGFWHGVPRWQPLAHYRAGKWKECIEACDKFVGNKPTMPYHALPLFFKSMALRQLGDKEQATKVLTDAREFFESLTLTTSTYGDIAEAPHWWCIDGMHAQIAYREASEFVLKQRGELKLALAIEPAPAPARAIQTIYHQPRSQFDTAIANDPANPSFYLQRSHWYAVRHQWPEARADLEAYLQRAAGNVADLEVAAALCLHAGDQAAYERYARVIRGQLPGKTSGGSIAGFLRILLLNRELDEATLNLCAAKTSELQLLPPKHYTYISEPLLLYRQGKWQACIDSATQHFPAGAKHPTFYLPLFYKAMAIHQLGDNAAAKKELEAVQQYLEGCTLETTGYVESTPEQRLMWWWGDGLQSQIAYREASELILKERRELNVTPAIDPRWDESGRVLKSSETKPRHDPVDSKFPPGFQDGKQDFALSFDGTAHVDLPLWYDGSHPISIEAFVAPAARENVGTVIANFHLAGLGIDASGTPLRWQIFANDGVGADRGYQKAIADQPFQVLQRVHLAGVRDGDRLRLYIDGKLQSSAATLSGFKNTTLPFYVGADPNASYQPEHFFHGVIDEVRISRSARYTDDFTPAKRLVTDADTLALYHFDEGAGNRLNDSSGNGYHGTIQNAKWVRADAVPVEMIPLSTWHEKGRAHWRAGDLEQARQTYEQLVKQSPTSYYEHAELAALCLALGDEKAFREHCQALLAQADQIASPTDRVQVLRLICLVPDFDRDLAAKLRVDFATADAKAEWIQRTHALWLHRHGQWPDAVAKADAYNSTFSALPLIKAQCLLVRAMAFWQLGDQDKAREALASAERLALQPVSESSTAWAVVPNQLYAQIIYREATKLIRGKSQDLVWPTSAPAALTPPPAITLPQLAAIEAHRQSISAVVVAPIAGVAITGGVDATVHLWDLKQHKHLQKLTEARADIGALGVSPDNHWLAIGTTKGEIELWDLTTRLFHERWPNAGAFVRSLVFSPDSQRLYIAGKHIYVWQVADKPSAIRPLIAQGVMDLALTKDGQTLLTGAHDGRVGVYDISGNLQHEFSTGGMLHGMDLSPDDKSLLTVGGMGTADLQPGQVQIWDWSSKARVKNFVGHRGFASDGEYTPDGRHVVTGGRNDRTLRVWNVETEQEVARFESKSHCFAFLTVEPSGQNVISGGGTHYEFGKYEDDGDNRLFLWDLSPIR